MRDEIVCVIILIVLMGLFAYSNNVINTCSNIIIQKLDEVEKAIDGAGDEKKLYDEVYDMWMKKKKPLFYICGHTLIMQIDENISLGREYIKAGDSDRGIYNLKKAQILLKDLVAKEKLSMGNIL